MLLSRGTLFLKRAELSVPFFRICAGLWVPFEETCIIISTILGNCGKNCKEEQRMCKVLDDFIAL